ncbi:MAG: glycosyltransferase [Rhodovibrionaceae bacterium]|nr:glycosyltransferase [Rhodovibrionaceae bacterium]
MSAGTGHALIYVQHLLGIGHLRRAAALARALDRAGFAVTLVSGGAPVAHLELGAARFVQLPAVLSADEAFSAIVDAEGHPVDAAFQERRRALLLSVLEETAPDVVITEAFPFGRRQLHFELLPFLDRANAMRPRPLIISSIRDVLQQNRKPERIRETVELVRARFDRVLVHGDPRLIRLEDSFPKANEIADKIVYTGYIADEGQPPASAPLSERREIVVSAGGGAVGGKLLLTALDARALSAAAEWPWRVLAGGNLPQEAFDALRRAAPESVTVERARPDFRALLRNARASISQAGYNTVMDILSTGTPAVLVPFAAGEQSEQSLRARRLADHKMATVVSEADLRPDVLAQALDRTLRLHPARTDIDLDGADESARLIARWLDAARADAANAP